MQPIITTESFKRVTLIALAIAFAATTVLCGVNQHIPSPRRIESSDGVKIKHYSLEESKQVLAEAASLMLVWTGRWPLEEKHILEVLNCAIELAQTGDANAEYIIGWMYEHGRCRYDHVSWARPVLERALEPFYQSNVIGVSDNEWAGKWYARADEHGSPDAPLALGLLKEKDAVLQYSYFQTSTKTADSDETFRCYKKAVARGNVESMIYLGQAYENLGTKSDIKRAMELYEQATKAEYVETVDSAILHVLWLWKTKHATPSADFARGAANVFDFLSHIDPALNDRKFANFFEVWGCSPEPYDQYRAELVDKIRHSLGLSSASAFVPIIIRGLKDGSEDVRQQTRAELRRFGEGAVPALMRLLDDNSPDMRVQSLQCLAWLGKDAEPAIGRMIELLVNDPDESIRQAAGDAIRGTGAAAAPAVTELLNHPALRVRLDSAKVLASIGPGAKAAVPALIKLLKSPEDDMRCASANALGCIGPDAKAAVPILIQWLRYPRQSSENRAAHRAFGVHFKAAAVADLLRALQSDSSETLRTQSASCLCEIGPDAGAAIPALIALIRVEPSLAVCRYSVDALAFIGAHKPDGIAALQSALKDQRPDVQKQAAMRLREISEGLL